MQPLLHINPLSVAIQQAGKFFQAVENVELSINTNQTVGLVGESGSGKTVLALSILDLMPRGLTKRSGKIIFKGQNLMQVTPPVMRHIRGQQIAMIFQEPMSSLNPLHRIGRQIGEMITAHHLVDRRGRPWDKDRLSKRVMQLVHMVGLDRDNIDAYPHQMSGGQRQRVMIAMALANQPDLLICDEPTTALDVTVQNQIIDLLIDLKNKLSMAMLFISHDLDLVRRLADTVYVMQKSRIVEHGQQVFTAPHHAYTKHLLSCQPQPKTASRTPKKALVKIRQLSVTFPAKRVGINSSTYQSKLSWSNLWQKPVYKAVDNINLDIYRHRTLGLVGQSGCGKTSLAMALLRLEKSQGSIQFDGQRIDKLKTKTLRQLRRRMQVVFQDPFASLNPRLSVGTIISEGLRAHSLENNTDRQVIDILQEIGLEPEIRYRFPHEFSGGQRQRIAIARALVLKPEFIVFDEPTSALDLSVQKQILDLLITLQKRFSLTYLFISHDLKVLSAIADDIAVMQAGKIVESGPFAQVVRNPKHTYSQTLLKSLTLKHYDHPRKRLH